MNDQIDDITENVQDDLEQGNDADRYTFGAPNAGWTGSLAASASATSGNTQNRDVSLAGRLSYGRGVWAHSFGFAGEFGQTDDTKTKQKIYGTYEANRYFNDTTFAFATARASVDEFGALAKDAFIGFGPRMRVIKQDDMKWRIQASPGIRYSEDQAGNETTRVSGIVSSRFWYKMNHVMSVNNDTDILTSDASTVATNDLGMNYKMTDTLSTLVSYRTEYNSDPSDGRKNTDNTLGVSLVLGF